MGVGGSAETQGEEREDGEARSRFNKFEEGSWCDVVRLIGFGVEEQRRTGSSGDEGKEEKLVMAVENGE